jgi:hypothetical protein
MAIQLGVAARNARLDAIETAVGTSPILTLRSGAQPADCAAANSGTVISTINCPSDWAAAASAGAKAKSGSWADASADASGTAAHFRMHDSGGSVCHMQGSVGLGAGDLSLDNNVIVAGQPITINTFNLTDGNA